MSFLDFSKGFTCEDLHIPLYFDFKIEKNLRSMFDRDYRKYNFER